MNIILLLYTLGNLIDYITTAWGFQFPGAIEGNPLMAFLINYYGMEAVLVVKILATFLIWYIAKKLHKSKPKKAFYVAYFFAAVPQWVVVFNNMFWMSIVIGIR